MSNKQDGKVFKIVRPKRIRHFLIFLEIIFILTWASINIYRVAIVTVRETIKTADYLIAEEQKRDLKRFEEKTAIADEHINELESYLENIKVGRWAKLSEEQKRDLLKITWELRKDSLRIENSLINHQSDWSVNFYPRRDEVIEDKMREYWQTNILIDRVVEDTERFVYSAQGVDVRQLGKLLR